jgi:hypothetical protein
MLNSCRDCGWGVQYLLCQPGLSVNIASKRDEEDYIPVRVISEGMGMLQSPFFYKSNFIFTLASADGLIRSHRCNRDFCW